MKPLPVTPELLRVAPRAVWFEEPGQALTDPMQFLAHVMVFGSVEYLACAGSSARRNIVRRWNVHRQACLRRDPGPTGI